MAYLIIWGTISWHKLHLNTRVEAFCHIPVPSPFSFFGAHERVNELHRLVHQTGFVHVLINSTLFLVALTLLLCSDRVCTVCDRGQVRSCKLLFRVCVLFSFVLYHACFLGYGGVSVGRFASRLTRILIVCPPTETRAKSAQCG